MGMEVVHEQLRLSFELPRLCARNGSFNSSIPFQYCQSPWHSEVVMNKSLLFLSASSSSHSGSSMLVLIKMNASADIIQQSSDIPLLPIIHQRRATSFFNQRRIALFPGMFPLPQIRNRAVMRLSSTVRTSDELNKTPSSATVNQTGRSGSCISLSSAAIDRNFEPNTSKHP